MPSTVPDFDNPGQTVVSPGTLAHVVLRTNNFKKMEAFYVTFLGGHVVFSNDMLSFITYDDEHHRIALANCPSDGPKAMNTAGLEHIAFTHASVADLLLAYRQRKAHGIVPEWCVNHGPTTSFYYRDPDGNALETQVDNFATADEATAFMMSDVFKANAIGVDADPEDLIARMRKGESEADLKRYDASRKRPKVPGLESLNA